MSRSSVRYRAIFMLVAALAASPAAAQNPDSGGPDPATIHVRLGPVLVKPMFSLANIGVDTNVFNDPADPKHDITFMASPKGEFWLRVGRTWLNGTAGEDIVWYQKYASERSVNHQYQISWSVPLTRVAFKVGAEYLGSHDRPGYEIDTRAERTETAVNAAMDVWFLTDTSIGMSASRRMVGFAEGSEFMDTSLHNELTHVRTTGAINLSRRLTPLTTVTFSALREQERFEFNPLRDSESTGLSGSLKFDPVAVIKGVASFGYRDFKPAVADVPGYKGTTAAVDVFYTALGSVKLSMKVNRDVQYSFDINQPYYVQTGFGGELAQQVYGPYELVVRGALARLEYRDREGAIVESANRVDRVRTYGGGFAYHLSAGVRLGFDVNGYRRRSPVDVHQYNGVKYGGSVIYAF